MKMLISGRGKKGGNRLFTAESIAYIPSVFQPFPLKGEELKDYYINTMSVRTGDMYDNPIDDIYDDCTNSLMKPHAYLLVGNRGCGKSTELSNLSKRLIKEQFFVTTVMCNADLDITDPVYSDLLILVGYNLLMIADETHCSLSRKTKNVILHFWEDVERTEEITTGSENEISGDISVESPLPILIKAIASIKTSMSSSREKRIICRKSIQRRAIEWIDTLNLIAKKIKDKTGKPPVVIFEDLDKLDSDGIFKVFFSDASKLAGFEFPIIYTFPSAFSYDPRFNHLKLNFDIKIFPMIPLELQDGTYNNEGYEVIERIVFKRANPILFDEDALKLMIKKTGGSLRTLFAVITDSSNRARRRKSNQIQVTDAEIALEKQRNLMIRCIESEDYAFLLDIYNGNRRQIKNIDKLLSMLGAGVVLDYSGWHNVHPLIVDFFKEQGLMQNE